MLPSESLGYAGRIIPHPILELRIDHDYGGAVKPTILRKASFYLPF
jgi:hypothetical protein